MPSPLFPPLQDKLDIAANIDLVAPAASKLRLEANIAEAIRRSEGVKKKKGAAATAAPAVDADMDGDSDEE